jgi:hypothetical protein
MYQGSNKGGGGTIGWGAGAGPRDTEDLVDADEAFEGSSGNEAVVCQDPADPGGTGQLIAVAHLSTRDGSVQWTRAPDPDAVLRRCVLCCVVLYVMCCVVLYYS